ncbi:MAG: hypothetical protein RSA10_03025 [Bacilli bacterium]
MRERIVNGISISIGIIVFIFLIKLFYFDTNMGFETKILELNYSAFPMFIDVIICLIFFPLIVYGLVQQFGEFILQKINDYQLS